MGIMVLMRNAILHQQDYQKMKEDVDEAHGAI